MNYPKFVKENSPNLNCGVQGRLIGVKDLIQPFMGMAKESGELLDLLEKHVYMMRDLPRKELLLELGDVMFYVYQACNALDVLPEEVMVMNVEKLNQRKKRGFK